jgi:PLP dependent protein
VFEVANIRDFVAAVKDRMAGACNRAGRSPADVRLVAVTKNVDLEKIREVVSLGVTDFGENYVQEARPKIEMLHEGIHWHMIGHIQRNKIKYIPRLFDFVHSVDRWEVLEGLEKYEKEMAVLFEVNLSREAGKHGTEADDVRRLLEKTGTLKSVRPVGLMTMAPYTENPEDSRRVFAELRNMLERFNKEFCLAMDELSMGMSSDFEVAIEEGATMVRVGTAIFGERVYTSGGDRR